MHLLHALLAAALAADPKPPSVVDIAAGGDHTCALLSDGTVKCWGSNVRRQLGIGNTAHRGDGPGDEMGDQLPRVNLGTAGKVKAISAGPLHTCALFESGAVQCWGDTAPPLDLRGRTVTRVLAGDSFTCVVLAPRGLSCWGLPGSSGKPFQWGQLKRIATPLRLLFAGGHSVCAVFAADARCWDASQGYIDIPFGEASDPKELGAVYGPWSCAAHQGVPRCWSSRDAQVDLGKRPPLALDDAGPVRAISVGQTSACVASSRGQVQCWPILGDMDSSRRTTIRLGGAARKVTVGWRHACALLEDGTVKCWGHNSVGQLGTGDTRDRDGAREDLSPVRLFGQAQAPAELRTAYMVILSGSTSEEEAKRVRLNAIDPTIVWRPEPDSPPDRERLFPMLVESATVSGLKPGFWVYVSAFPKSEDTAKRLVTLLGKGVYYRKVSVANPQDLVVWANGSEIVLGTPAAAAAAGADLKADLGRQRAAPQQMAPEEPDDHAPITGRVGACELKGNESDVEAIQATLPELCARKSGLEQVGAWSCGVVSASGTSNSCCENSDVRGEDRESWTALACFNRGGEVTVFPLEYTKDSGGCESSADSWCSSEHVNKPGRYTVVRSGKQPVLCLVHGAGTRTSESSRNCGTPECEEACPGGSCQESDEETLEGDRQAYRMLPKEVETLEEWPRACGR